MKQPFLSSCIHQHEPLFHWDAGMSINFFLLQVIVFAVTWRCSCCRRRGGDSGRVRAQLPLGLHYWILKLGLLVDVTEEDCKWNRALHAFWTYFSFSQVAFTTWILYMPGEFTKFELQTDILCRVQGEE